MVRVRRSGDGRDACPLCSKSVAWLSTGDRWYKCDSCRTGGFWKKPGYWITGDAADLLRGGAGRLEPVWESLPRPQREWFDHQRPLSQRSIRDRVDRYVLDAAREAARERLGSDAAFGTKAEPIRAVDIEATARASIVNALTREAERATPRPSGRSRPPAGERAKSRKAFISYRREDTAFVATAVYHRLADQLKDGSVFIDIDTIPAGVDFVEHLTGWLDRTDAVVAIIGKDWLTAADADGKRRLDDPADFVRVEIATALARGIPVFPILVEGTPMPKAHQLPEELSALATRQALALRPGKDFYRDVDDLAEQIGSLGSDPG